jgi:hypothetical protein
MHVFAAALYSHTETDSGREKKKKEREGEDNTFSFSLLLKISVCVCVCVVLFVVHTVMVKTLRCCCESGCLYCMYYCEQDSDTNKQHIPLSSPSLSSLSLSVVNSVYIGMRNRTKNQKEKGKTERERGRVFLHSFCSLSLPPSLVPPPFPVRLSFLTLPLSLSLCLTAPPFCPFFDSTVAAYAGAAL